MCVELSTNYRIWTLIVIWPVLTAWRGEHNLDDLQVGQLLEDRAIPIDRVIADQVPAKVAIDESHSQIPPFAPRTRLFQASFASAQVYLANRGRVEAAGAPTVDDRLLLMRLGKAMQPAPI